MRHLLRIAATASALALMDSSCEVHLSHAHLVAVMMMWWWWWWWWWIGRDRARSCPVAVKFVKENASPAWREADMLVRVAKSSAKHAVPALLGWCDAGIAINVMKCSLKVLRTPCSAARQLSTQGSCLLMLDGTGWVGWS